MRPWIEPESLWTVVGFVTAEPRWELRYIIVFTVDRHLCHFQFEVIVSNGAINIFVSVFWGNKHSFLFGTCLGVTE